MQTYVRTCCIYSAYFCPYVFQAYRKLLGVIDFIRIRINIIMTCATVNAVVKAHSSLN